MEFIDPCGRDNSFHKSTLFETETTGRRRKRFENYAHYCTREWKWRVEAFACVRMRKYENESQFVEGCSVCLPAAAYSTFAKVRISVRWWLMSRYILVLQFVYLRLVKDVRRTVVSQEDSRKRHYETGTKFVTVIRIRTQPFSGSKRDAEESLIERNLLLRLLTLSTIRVLFILTYNELRLVNIRANLVEGNYFISCRPKRVGMISSIEHCQIVGTCFILRTSSSHKSVLLSGLYTLLSNIKWQFCVWTRAWVGISLVIVEFTQIRSIVSEKIMK